MHDLENIRRLAASLRDNLAKCATDPDVDPVHDTRTGTRRLQATLESLIRGLPEGEPAAAVSDAATSTMRVLKKIRRAAGEVRDLDVHRKLLTKLARRALDPENVQEKDRKTMRAAPDAGPGQTLNLIEQPDVLESPQAGFRVTGLAKQADDLDAWLKHRRTLQTAQLQAQAPAALVRLDKRLRALEEALRAKGLRLRRKKMPAVVALEAFVRLATEMQALHVANLHDFRKGAKKARYVAELAASGDAEAARVGDALRKLQDEIGDWHDWLVLAGEAHEALGDSGTELVALIEQQRDQHYSAAMKAAAKLRGRLMGEWLAVGRVPARRRRPVAPRRGVQRPPVARR